MDAVFVANPADAQQIEKRFSTTNIFSFKDKSFINRGGYIMTGRQKIFVDEFIATQNSAEAARRAGFNAGYANRQGHRLLKNPNIRSAIDARLEELDAARTARTKEILEMLTATMRGEVTETVATNTAAVAVVGNFNENLVADWLTFNADKAEATVRTYGRAIGSFLKWRAANNVESPARADIIRYRDELCATKKPATSRLYMVAVKNLFKWLASEGKYLDVAANVGLPKLDDDDADCHKREALTLEEAKSIIRSFKGKTDIKSMRDALILRLMLNCGLRSIEVVRLDANDIEHRHGKHFLKIWGKGRKGKTARVEVSKSVYAQILDYLNARVSKRAKGEAMFVSTARRNFGQRLTTKSISRIAKETFRAVGIDSELISCHSCRHFAATQALLEGVEIARVQRFLMRHKSVTTTAIYRHDLERATDNTVQILSDLLDVA